MRVIVAGAGEVGFNIARWLSLNGHSVTLIDRDPARVARASEVLDIQGVAGKGSVPQVLAEAGAEEAEIFVAVTDSDEVNITACLVAAHRFGVPHRVARIREVGYAEIGEILAGEHVGIDLVIHPEMEVASRIQRLVDFPAASEVLEFGDGTLRLAAFQLAEGSPLVGHPLERTFPPDREPRLLVAAVLRDGRVIIPRGHDRLHARDQIYLLGRPEDLAKRLPEVGLAGPPITHV
ncbi:MAG: Trk system potassium transporter TrkA, partial [Nitrospirae bacterium]